MSGFTYQWLVALLRRQKFATIGVIAGIAVTVALLASVFGFLASAEGTMTKQAIAGVAVDWQVQLIPGADAAAAQKELQQSPGYTNAVQVGYFNALGFESIAQGSTQTTGPGVVLGLGAGYLDAFPQEVRHLTGNGSVMLFQQTAASLHAAPGSVVTIKRPGLDPVQVTIGSVVDLPLADSLFKSAAVAPGAGPQAPPDNILILPLDQWHALFDPVSAISPMALHTQLHVSLPHNLPAAPAAAFTQVSGMARNYETRLAGAGVVSSNIAARLDTARADAAFARVLFLFLGVPGAALAAMLTIVIVSTGKERRRREQSLLKLRGASTSRVLGLAVSEALLLGLIGGAIGLGIAAFVVRATFGGWSFGTGQRASIGWALIAMLSGVALALLALVVPAWRSARAESVVLGRAPVQRRGSPIWERMGLDIILIGAAAFIYWRAGKNGYQIVLATEGAPRVAVSYTPFIAPLCLWAGAVLFALRCVRLLLIRGQRATRALVTPLVGRLSSLTAAAMGRQTSSLLPGVALAMLAIAFAISTATFNSTYKTQSRVDAQLTNGADVTIKSGPNMDLASQAGTIQALPGVASVSPMQHRFAYVGADLQDIFGVNPATIAASTQLSNAFFTGGTASALMAKLQATPDGLLVSQETVTDYQLVPGDTIKLRLLSATDHQYHVVPFHYIGIAREFPTAPKDSFLIANSSYLAAQTSNNSVETLLVKTNGAPGAVADAVRAHLGPASGASVQDIGSVERSISSELTAVSLNGLTRIELAFAVLLAAAGAGLVLAAGIDRRRRMLAVVTALGASARQVRGIVWSEASIVLAGGFIGGGALGFVAAKMLVKILTTVFDPAPQGMTVPWNYLIVVFVTAGASIVVAGGISARSGQQRVLETIRRF